MKVIIYVFVLVNGEIKSFIVTRLLVSPLQQTNSNVSGKLDWNN